jgi:DNA (cytosine-5)-methyltransferase 1
VKHLDLFSGIGGFALAARNVGWQTVAFCESEPFCQAVLRKHWPDVPIHDDVRTLDGRAVGPVDIITGGYPCQPFSLAGKRGGSDDDRHLWPEFARLIRELRPRWVLGENVAGHITLGLDDVLADLEGLGYAWEAFVIPAVAVDARHRRERLWIAAYAVSDELRQQPITERRRGGPIKSRDNGAQGPMADASSERRREAGQRSAGAGPEERTGSSGEAIPDAGFQRPRSQERPEERASNQSSGHRWLEEAESGVRRVADGIPDRMDRLRSLGNSIVPQVAEEIFRAIAATSK